MLPSTGLEETHPLQELAELDFSSELLALGALAKDLGRVSAPVTILHGQEDTLVPVDNVDYLADHRQRMNLCVALLEDQVPQPRVRATPPRHVEHLRGGVDAALGYSSDFGLFAEEAEPRGRRMLNNIPHSFVHATSSARRSTSGRRQHPQMRKGADQDRPTERQNRDRHRF